jgi:hypothetical protein
MLRCSSWRNSSPPFAAGQGARSGLGSRAGFSPTVSLVVALGQRVALVLERLRLHYRVFGDGPKGWQEAASPPQPNESGVGSL